MINAPVTQPTTAMMGATVLPSSASNPSSPPLQAAPNSPHSTIDSHSTSSNSHSLTNSPNSMSSHSTQNMNNVGVLTTTVTVQSSEDLRIYKCKEPNCTARFKTKSALTTHIHTAHATVWMTVFYGDCLVENACL